MALKSCARMMALVGAMFAQATFLNVSAALAQTEVNVYTGLTREQAEPVLAEFAAKYGKPVKFSVLSGPTEELVAQINLELQSGRTKADVLWIDQPQLEALNNAHKALAEVKSSHFDTLLPAIRTGNYKRSVPTGLLMYVIMYNTKSIDKAEVPTSFADLINDKWKNKIAVASPESSAGVHNFFWLIAEHLANKPGYGWDYFKKLHALNPTYPSGHGAIRDLVISGERPLGIQFIFNIAAPIDRGEAVWWVWPKEGVPTGVFSVGVIEQSKAKEVGLALADWMISPTGQASIAKHVALTPVNSTVYFEFKDKKKPADLNIVPVDGAYITAHRVDILENFQKIVRGR